MKKHAGAKRVVLAIGRSSQLAMKANKVLKALPGMYIVRLTDYSSFRHADPVRVSMQRAWQDVGRNLSDAMVIVGADVSAAQEGVTAVKHRPPQRIRTERSSTFTR
jgi:hypothetical protein